MKAIILSVGNEVLSGRVINTNTSYLSQQLEKIGYDVVKTVVVGDDEAMLTNEVLSFVNSEYDVLITTGGLGPTHDDFTKEVICKTFGYDLVLREEALDTIKRYYKKEFAHSNIKQAYFPENAILLENSCGTAMGAILEKNGKSVILLVGPPMELIPMYEKGAEPYLKSLLDENFLIHEFIVMGIGESSAEDYLEEYFNKFPHVNIAPYANLGKIRYQITALQAYQENFNKAVDEFRRLMDKYITSEENKDIEEVLVSLLKEKGYKISFAESCTGGKLASKIINVDGSSAVINESLVTYSNESKVKYLNVSNESISKYGVVSDQIVLEMVEGLKKLTNSDICVSVSGIAGPTGGSIEKPVGLVHYAISTPKGIICEHQVFRGNRNNIRERATLYILYKVYKILLEK